MKRVVLALAFIAVCVMIEQAESQWYGRGGDYHWSGSSSSGSSEWGGGRSYWGGGGRQGRGRGNNYRGGGGPQGWDGGKNYNQGGGGQQGWRGGNNYNQGRGNPQGWNGGKNYQGGGGPQGWNGNGEGWDKSSQNRYNDPNRSSSQDRRPYNSWDDYADKAGTKTDMKQPRNGPENDRLKQVLENMINTNKP